MLSLQVTYKEIEEMIRTVDKNGDGKINYSEFRVMMGAHPLIIPGPHLAKFTICGNSAASPTTTTTTVFTAPTPTATK